MESTLLNTKFLIFIGLLVVVTTTMGAVMIAAVYQIIRDKVLKTRRRDGIARDEAALKTS